MRKSSYHIIALVGGLFFMASACAATWTFTSFDAPGSHGYTYSGGINDNGQVAGYYVYSGGDPNKLGFTGSVGSLISIGDPASDHWTDAMGINNSGVVAGNYSIGSIFHVFFYNSNTSAWTNYSAPVPGTSPVLLGISNLGVVAGWYQDGKGLHGFTFDGNLWATLDNPAAVLGTSSGTQAAGINILGHVVGVFQDAVGYHGFLYNGSTYTTLDVPGAAPGTTYSFGINDLDQVVGYFHDTNGIPHGFLYSAGTYLTYDAPLATRGTEARGINNKGLITGSYYDACCSRGFVATPASSDWPMAGYDVQRTGYNPNEVLLGAKNVAAVSVGWTFSPKEAALAQPVVASQVAVAGTPTDIVYLGTVEGNLYALNAATGSLLWQRNLGSVKTSCGTVHGGQFGFSSAPFFDRQHMLLFVAGGDGILYALDPATGTVYASAQAVSDPHNQQVYGSLALNNGYLYATVGSVCGQVPWYGKAVAFSVSGLTNIVSEAASFYPAKDSATPVNYGGGGIWGAAGPSIDPATGDVLVGTGGTYGSVGAGSTVYTDAVVRLSGQAATLLQPQASFSPLLQGGTVDFGSTPVIFQPKGCPAQVAALNKNGLFALFNKDSIAAGPTQTFQVSDPGNSNDAGNAAFNPTANSLYIVSDSDPNLANDPANPFKHGLIAFDVQSDCTLKLSWQTNAGVNNSFMTSPVTANGVVYYANGTSLYAVDASSGNSLAQIQTPFAAPIKTPPTVVNGQIYVLTQDGKLTMLH